ncbi:hypothetical protein C1646_802806 [Rhizophagus diaphanus]|nr:hypothetical protein C1646_802806 [Rhizophagus diaphanus] [Rhizophagus sp. MUCL 43196]
MGSDDEKSGPKLIARECILEIKFWEKYQKIQENSNEYVKEKLEELMVTIENERNEIKRKLRQILEELGMEMVEKNLVQVSDKEFDESDESNETDKSNKSDEFKESENTKIFEEIIRTDLKKLDYDMKITEIERIRKFGVPASIITTYEFMKKYLTIWNLEDKELDKLIFQWRTGNTRACEKCEVEKLKKEFRVGKEICVECEEIVEKENSSGDEEEEEKSIKGPEIGSSKKLKSKEKDKKPIIPIVPIILITPIIPIKLKITMETIRNEMSADLATFANVLYEQDIGLNWAAPAALGITLTGLQGEIQNNTNAIGNLNANRRAIVEIPMFYRTKEEYPEEWVNKFKETFTANGLENDDTQKFRIAKAKLMGGASDWLKTKGVNIVNWNVNGNNNLRLRARIVEKYVSDEVKDKWLE